MKKRLGPYSYLIIPLFLEDGNIKDFKRYIKRCAQSEECQWELGRVIPNASGDWHQRLSDFYRSSASYSFLHQLFHPFVTDNPNDLINDECCVLRYKGIDEFDEPLSYIAPREDRDPITFGIFNNPNSFDALKLILNLKAMVGLLVIPTSSNVAANQYGNMLYELHVTSLRCIVNRDFWKEDKSINDLIDKWMSDFEGWYHQFNEEYAHHLTYVSVNPDTSDADCRLWTSSITTCSHNKYSKGMSSCQIEVYPPRVYIGVATQGMTIMTLLPDNPTNRQIQYYHREHTEHYMLYMMCLMQRYALLKVIADLSTIDNPSRPKSWIIHKWEWMAKRVKSSFRKNRLFEKSHVSMNRRLKRVRELTKVISITQIKNNFNSISDFPEYNMFYKMCCDALGIKALYEETEKKMKRVDAYLTQVSDENKERADWMLSLILAFLTVFSATKDIKDLTEEVITKDPPMLYYIVAAFAIIPVMLLFYTIIKTFRR